MLKEEQNDGARKRAWQPGICLLACDSCSTSLFRQAFCTTDGSPASRSHDSSEKSFLFFRKRGSSPLSLCSPNQDHRTLARSHLKAREPRPSLLAFQRGGRSRLFGEVTARRHSNAGPPPLAEGQRGERGKFSGRERS